jgi:DNA replication protein DnaC
MLIEQTFQQLSVMRMHGFTKALQEQIDKEDFRKLAFDERVSLLVDREYRAREDRKLTRRLQQARLRESACLEDIDYRHSRGLDKVLMRRLASCAWLKKKQNIIVTGPTGAGKTYVACALADKACREGHAAIYRRMPRLLQELLVARADGSYTKLLARIAKMDLLVVDDWGISPMHEQERRDILEVFEDRHGNRSTILVSQLPVDKWHAYIGDPTIADAILDRLVHNAHQIKLSGGSMRKANANLAQTNSSGD